MDDVYNMNQCMKCIIKLMLACLEALTGWRELQVVEYIFCFRHFQKSAYSGVPIELQYEERSLWNDAIKYILHTPAFN